MKIFTTLLRNLEKHSLPHNAPRSGVRLQDLFQVNSFPIYVDMSTISVGCHWYKVRFISNNIMRVVKQDKYGGPETLYIGEGKIPEPGSKEVLVEVHGSAVNRADLLLSRGMYPGQPKTPQPLGLELSGIIKNVGDAVSVWKVGNRVMALVSSGGYAEYAAVKEDHVMSVPDGLSLKEAGGIPEVWLTSFQLLHLVGNVKPGDFVLIHGGGSGVGTASVQLVRLAGAIPIVTAGTKEKIDKGIELGAKAGFNYKEDEFADKVMNVTGGKGVDLILDCVGGSFWEQNLKCLAFEGTWINFGLLGGGRIEGNLLGPLLSKRCTLKTSTLKSRSDAYKAHLISEFCAKALPYFTKPAVVNGEEIKLSTIIDTEFSVDSVAEAHTYLAQNKNIGKVLLVVKKDS